MSINFCNSSFWIFLLTLFLLPCSFSQKITQSVSISYGAVNGVFIERNGKKLVVYGDPDEEIKKADMVLFTHFRRDVIWAGRKLVQNGSRAVLPYAEKSYFTKGDSIWSNYTYTRYHEYFCQTTKIGITPVEVNRFVNGGEVIKWQDLDFKVFKTPGYTRGSVSYIADIDNKRFAFVGDLIFGDGKIFDLYSFQDTLGRIKGYHGYAVRLGQLISSLELIAGQKPDFLVPVRGPIIKDPNTSIQKLIHHVRAVYHNYLSTSAYLWYNQKSLSILSNHILGSSANVQRMPFASVIQNNPPSWYVHINNSNLILSGDNSAFLIDCGGVGTLKNLLDLKESGQLKTIDGVFITHYHDDHTNFINDVVKEFKCPVYVTKELKDILENPAAYRLPAITTDPIPGLTIVQEGQKMSWKEFIMSFYYFPGQTIYHDAVLFQKKNGESIFFIGDSFTPTGMDDYCLLLRNFLHQGTGYFYCLDLLKNLPENTLLANQHVTPPFAFSEQQLDLMTNLLLERKNILKELLPWDDINYGLDEQWIRFYPYGQKVTPGQTINTSIKVFNHSPVAKNFFIKLNLPEGYSLDPANTSIRLEPHKEGEKRFTIKVPGNVSPGVSLITANVKFGNWDLHEWCEALLEISP